VHCLHIIGKVAVEEGTFTGTHNQDLRTYSNPFAS
jgi:hypothetical protein